MFVWFCWMIKYIIYAYLFDCNWFYVWIGWFHLRMSIVCLIVLSLFGFIFLFDCVVILVYCWKWLDCVCFGPIYLFLYQLIGLFMEIAILYWFWFVGLCCLDSISVLASYDMFDHVLVSLFGNWSWSPKLLRCVLDFFPTPLRKTKHVTSKKI